MVDHAALSRLFFAFFSYLLPGMVGLEDFEGLPLTLRTRRSFLNSTFSAIVWTYNKVSTTMNWIMTVGRQGRRTQRAASPVSKAIWRPFYACYNRARPAPARFVRREG